LAINYQATRCYNPEIGTVLPNNTVL